MCDNDRSSSVAAEVGLVGASSSFSLSSLSSCLPRSPVAHSRRFGIDPDSEAAPERDDPPVMCLATAERLYRCLGVGRAARAGDVLLQPGACQQGDASKVAAVGVDRGTASSLSHCQGLCRAAFPPAGRRVRPAVRSKHSVPVVRRDDTHPHPEPIPSACEGRPGSCYPTGSSLPSVPPLPELQCHSLCWWVASHVSRPGKPRHRWCGRRVSRARATAGRGSLGLAGGVDGRKLQVCNSRRDPVDRRLP